MSETEAQHPVREGDVLSGKFKVEKILGMGGMGVVVAARHLQLDQRVALKFMLPAALANQDATARFMREARAAAKLRSEHIARVLDVGTLDDGAPYIVMELLDGQDVATMLENGPLSLGLATGIILHACAAVAEAHAVGIVHRDLKPRNLFMTTDVEGKPLVKVLDFGISKELAPPGAGEAPGSLTKTSMMLGSPHYMSPEQLKSSRDVDARADVWSLGVCLFELLSKNMPFSAPSIAELCALVLAEKAPHLTSPEVPREVDAILQRCLEKQPGDRFSTVSELATALEPFADRWARPAAERARNVLKNSRQTGPAPIATPGASDGTLATGPTVATWDTSASASRPRKSHWPLVLAGIGAVVSVALVGALVAASHHPAAATAPPPKATTTPELATVTVTVTATAAATATASATATATASVTAAVTAATSTHRPPAPKSSAKPRSDDDYLQGRN